MLKSVRNALKGVVAWIVIALLVLSFAAFGVPEIRNFGGDSALKVGDQSFTSAEIRSELAREVANRRQEQSGYTYANALSDGLPQQVVNQIASRSAIEQQATALGLAMPRDLVREILNSDERFQDPNTGEFNSTVLGAILQFYNMSVQQFERLMRSEFLRNQLVTAVASGPGAPTSFADAIVFRDIEARDITYALVDEALAEPAATPTDGALRAFHASNAERFTAPEFRTLTYIPFRLADFESAEAVTEEQLLETYEANRERLYETPEARTLYQTRFDTEAEAEAAVADLNAGKPFEEIAASRGQSLSSVTFEDISASDLVDPNVREAAFAEGLGAGAVVGPVQGLFPGYVVIQIVDATPPTTKSFEEVRDEIRTAFLANETRRMIYEAVETVENQRDTGASLADAARAAGVDPKIIGPVDAFSFGAGGEVVADVPGEVLAEAFRLEEGLESDALEYADDGGYFFVAVDEVTPAALRPYEDVAEDVLRAYERDDRKRRVAAAVAKLRAAAAESDLGAAAALAGAKVASVTVDRGGLDAADLSEELAGRVFLANVGDVIEGAGATPGARALVEIRAARHDPARINPAQSAVLKQYLALQLDQELFDAYVSSVRDDLGVKTDAASIDAIVAEGG